MKASSSTLTLSQAVFPRVAIWRDVLLVAGGSILTALCAQIAFFLPFSPVPLTGQMFAVLLVGATLGSRRGALSMLTYVAIGATSIPFWFAPGKTVGIARLLSPSVGYLIGFVVAAFVVGWLAERGWDRRWYTSMLAMFAGTVAVWVLGWSVLRAFVPDAVVLVYVPGDIIKLVLAALTLPSAWALVKRFQKKA